MYSIVKEDARLGEIFGIKMHSILHIWHILLQNKDMLHDIAKKKSITHFAWIL